MKALIVDDNPSVIAILTEILKIDGHEVFTAMNWNDAERELSLRKPDIMFLDSIVEQKSMISFVDELDENINTRIVLILNGREQVPKDTSLIVRSIKKPFNSTEVLEAVNFVGGGCTASPKPTEKKTKWYKFLMKSRDGNGSVEKYVSDNPVMQGKSYVVYEDVPDKIYNLANKFKGTNGDVLIITGGRKKAIETKVSLDGISYITLSRTSKEDYVDIKALGTLMFRIMEHTRNNFWPVIIIDDLTQIIYNNDLNSVLTFIYQIYKGVTGPVTLAVSVKETLLTEKDKLLLYKYMEIYKPDEEDLQGDEIDDI